MSGTSYRWETAQKSEKAWWQAHSDHMNLAFYMEFADDWKKCSSETRSFARASN